MGAKVSSPGKINKKPLQLSIQNEATIITEIRTIDIIKNKKSPDVNLVRKRGRPSKIPFISKKGKLNNKKGNK